MQQFVNDFYTVIVPPTDFSIPGNPNIYYDIDVNNFNSLIFFNIGNRNVQIPYNGGVLLNYLGKLEMKSDFNQLYKGKLTVSFRKSGNQGKLLIIRKRFI